MIIYTVHRCNFCTPLFTLRFGRCFSSQRSPVCSQWTQKYKPEAAGNGPPNGAGMVSWFDPVLFMENHDTFEYNAGLMVVNGG